MKETIEWHECIEGQMPEDLLPKKAFKSYKLWGEERKRTDYMLVCREQSEQIDTAIRVHVGDKWYWSNGNGISKVLYWAAITRPIPWDEEAHQKHINEFMQKAKEYGKGKM